MDSKTRWIIYFTNYYCRILGVLSFSYDIRTGKACKKLRITVYCALINLMSASVIPYFLATMKYQPPPAAQPDLHYKMGFILGFLRIGGVMITLATNWLQRDDFIRNLNDFQKYRERFLRKWSMKEKYYKYFQRRILTKIALSIFLEIVILYGAVWMLRYLFDIRNPFVLMVLGMLSTILNLMGSHYVIVMMRLNVLFCVINDEVKTVLNAVGDLYRLHYWKRIRQGAFMHQCCQLADDLDELALAHFQLQNITARINKMYYIQGCCLLIIVYMSNSCAIYFGYMLFTQEELRSQIQWSSLGVIVLILVFYYGDGKLLIGAILNFIEDMDKAGVMLKNRQPWLPTLDERLERSLQNFSLQMAAFPIERSLLYLFDITPGMVFATLTSTVSNAIVLIQYDYKNSKNMLF